MNKTRHHTTGYAYDPDMGGHEFGSPHPFDPLPGYYIAEAIDGTLVQVTVFASLLDGVVAIDWNGLEPSLSSLALVPETRIPLREL